MLLEEGLGQGGQDLGVGGGWSMDENLGGQNCWHLPPYFKISLGHRQYFGNIIFILNLLEALTDCLTPFYLLIPVLGEGEDSWQYELPHSGQLLCESSVGAGAEGCPAKKPKPNRAWFLGDYFLQTIKRSLFCMLFTILTCLFFSVNTRINLLI